MGGNPISKIDPEGLQAFPGEPSYERSGIFLPDPFAEARRQAALALDRFFKRIKEFCTGDSPEECKKKCDDAYQPQIDICNNLPTRRGRQACYENAVELYSQCLRNCT